MLEALSSEADHDLSTPGPTSAFTTSSTRREDPSLLSPLSADLRGLANSSIRRFCSEAVFDTIIQDYLTVIYPLVPVIHCPTFQRDLKDERHLKDVTFQSLCLTICGLVLGTIPHKFEEYRLIDGSLRYANRREAVKHIHGLILQSRPDDYFDKLSQEKWAISYMMSTTVGHFGHEKRSKMYYAETNAIGMELGIHQVSSYNALNHIEAQLWKKSFWLSFTSYSSVFF